MSLVYVFVFLSSFMKLSFSHTNIDVQHFIKPFIYNGPKTYFDLSYAINNDTIYYPGQKDYSSSKDYDRVQFPGYVFSAYSFCMGEHGGTHIDAPYHFNPKGWTVEQIPQSNLIDVPASVINVESILSRMERPDRFVLEVQHLMEHESIYGQIPHGSVILMYTGWSRLWPDKFKYLGWNNHTTSEPRLNFPGFSEEAAKWLVQHRQVIGMGLDTPSLDAGRNGDAAPVHIYLSGNQIFGIENVANLHLLLAATQNTHCSLHLFILPLKIVGGTGAPARILAYCK